MNHGNRSDEQFRPAPFPVFAPDNRPQALSSARRLAAAILALLILTPLWTIPGTADSGEIRLINLSFNDREPVLLTCDFSLAEFGICPPELGTLIEDNQFVVSGSVDRGLLYGTTDSKRIAVLVSYDEDAMPSVDNLLDEIRAGVDQMNDRRNLLREAKEQAGPSPAEQTGTADWFWSPGPGEQAPDAFAGIAEQLRKAGLSLADVQSQLDARAGQLSRMKALYYGAQEARIDLLESQFSLQLAMAGSPAEEVPGMPAIGGSEAAKNAMLTETRRLSEAWSARLELLDGQLRRDRAWQSTASTPPPDSDWGVFSFIPGMRPPFEEQALVTRPEPSSDAYSLELFYRNARITVAEAESTAITRGLEKLARLEARVDQGLPPLTGVRRVAVSHSTGDAPDLEVLPGYATVGQIVRQGGLADMVGQLAAEFAGAVDAPQHGLPASMFPEVLYSMVVADVASRLPASRMKLQQVREPDAEVGMSEARLAAYRSFVEFERWCISVMQTTD